MGTDNWDGRVKVRFTVNLCFLLLFVACSLYAKGTRAETLGFVKAGAFVIPKEVNAKLKDYQTRLRVGYLPVGSVVWMNECKSLNENASSGIPVEKAYCEIDSEVGISGLIRKDRIHILSGPVIVALGKDPIPVYGSDGKKAYSPFSRNSGIYVDVIGKIENSVIPVMRPYTKPNPIPGLLKISELGNNVRLLNPKNLKLKKATIERLGNFSKDIIKKRFGDDIGKYFSKINNAVNKLEKQLGLVNNIACLIDGSVYADIGLKFFGTGAGVKIQAKLKNSGEMFKFRASVLSVGDQSTIVSSINRYACTNPPAPQPNWMMEFISVGAPEANPTEVLTVVGPSKPKGIFVVQDDPKMIEIGQWEDYEQKYKNIWKGISQKEFVKGMSDQARKVYAHYILSQISSFQSQ